MAYLYRHIRLDKNQPFYIGIGVNSRYTRAHEKVKRNRFWRNVVSKTEYEVEIVLDNLTWQEACEKEKEFISLYGRRDLGTGSLCNLTNGGEGVVGVIRTEEYRQNLRKANLGKKMSAESIEKLKEALVGRTHSLETRQKMSKTRTGKRLTSEHKNKIKKGHLGKTLSESHRLNLQKAKAICPILQYDLDGNFIKEWVSQREVNRSLKIARVGLTRCINGICKQAGGFVWKLKK
jgi:hypothetical protein